VPLILIDHVILGMFIEDLSSRVISLPLGLGFDPVRQGVVMVPVPEIGLTSPPASVTMFIVKSVVPDVRIETIFAGILAVLAGMIVAFAPIIAVPVITLLLPDTMYNQSAVVSTALRGFRPVVGPSSRSAERRYPAHETERQRLTRHLCTKSILAKKICKSEIPPLACHACAMQKRRAREAAPT
jgi:hypothetical protein